MPKQKVIINKNDEESIPEYKRNAALRDIIWKELCNMKHKDLQKACVIRGCEFDNIFGLTHPQLVLWFYENYNNTQDEDLLIAYDEYVDGILETMGKDKKHPVLRLSYKGGLDELKTEIISSSEPKPKKEKVDIDKTPSVKKEKHEEWGITKGTKKYLTYQLVIEEKLPINKIIEKVKDEFIDAEEKSIKIWAKRAEQFLKK